MIERIRRVRLAIEQRTEKRNNGKRESFGEKKGELRLGGWGEKERKGQRVSWGGKGKKKGEVGAERKKMG